MWKKWLFVSFRIIYFNVIFIFRNKSPKKQTKGVGVRKEKSKDVVKPTVLKKEAEKIKVEVPLSPHKALQQELWGKALLNVSNMSNLSDEEESIAKLLSDYKKKSSIPQKRIKLKVNIYLILLTLIVIFIMFELF